MIAGRARAPRTAAAWAPLANDAFPLGSRAIVTLAPAASTRATGMVIPILDDLATQFHASESRRLERLVHGRPFRDRSALGPGVKQAPFEVLVGSEMPSSLAGVGPITHPEDGRLLEESRCEDTIASTLAHGVPSFLGRAGEAPRGAS